MPKTGGIDRNAYVFCVLTAFHRWHPGFTHCSPEAEELAAAA